MVALADKSQPVYYNVDNGEWLWVRKLSNKDNTQILSVGELFGLSHTYRFIIYLPLVLHSVLNISNIINAYLHTELFGMHWFQGLGRIDVLGNGSTKSKATQSNQVKFLPPDIVQYNFNDADFKLCLVNPSFLVHRPC